MKNLLFLVLFLPLFTQAETDLKRIVQIYRTQTVVDKNLSENESMYTFEFGNVYDGYKSATVQYSIDGKNGEELLENNSVAIKAKPGKHIFQFYYNQYYYEVYSDSLEINERHHDTYRVTLFQAPVEVMSEKPVIYLYPQESTDVTMKMDIRGKNAFLYPTYTDSWKFTAQPNGDLIFGNNIYNYLFWEATHSMNLSPKQKETGFFVYGENAVTFLEDKLTKAGLNSKEQADFITYWGPRLTMNELNFVHFEFNDTCEKYAKLHISPEPDNLYRIYMVWSAVSEEFSTKEQKIEAFDRSGFSVLEWGGLESYIKNPFDVE